MRAASGRFKLALSGNKGSTAQGDTSGEAIDSGNYVSQPNGGQNAGGGGGGGFSLGLGSPGGNGHKGEGGGSGDFGKIIKNKVLHTTIMPNIVGTQSLRELQDLITAEKSILQSHERLASDLSKGASALATWGGGEGSDLADVTGHAAAILGHLARAMARFAEHEADVRVLLKSVRTREEELEEMQKRRKTLGGRAEREEKKLAKMGQENKNLPSQTELLESLRDQMRQLDTEILTEEAKVGDYKRLTAKKALGLKFGGCLELAEKATIVGELGKLLVEEIPLEETPPGYGRAPYNGFEQTQRLANEAARCISDVVFHPTDVRALPPGLPHTRSFEPLRTPSVGHVNGQQSDEYRQHAAAYGDDPHHPGAGGPVDLNAGGYDSAQIAPTGSQPQYTYNSATGRYETQQPQAQQHVPGHVMFDAPVSPLGMSRNGSGSAAAAETPTIDGRLESHDYEYQQALQAEVEARAAHADHSGAEGRNHDIELPNPHVQQEPATASHPHGLEASEPTGLAYLNDQEQRAGTLEPAAPVLPPIATGGSIMDRGRVTRKHGSDEYADNGSTSFFSRTFGSPTSPGRPTHEDVQAIDAAKDEVRREREAFGIAAGDEPAPERFYTPSASPGLGPRPGGLFPGAGQRTISASAFKRNKDRAPGSPIVANSPLEPAFSPTAPLNVKRPGSSLANPEGAVTAARPVTPVAGASRSANMTSAEQRRSLGVDDDVDVGLGAPLPPPVYGQSHNDTPISEFRPDLR